jgi:hypothetical protein
MTDLEARQWTCHQWMGHRMLGGEGDGVAVCVDCGASDLDVMRMRVLVLRQAEERRQLVFVRSKAEKLRAGGR